MKILVLGDSHAAAVKYGWDAMAGDHPDKTLDFFALPKVRMKKLVRDGTRLMPGPKNKPGDTRRLMARFPDGFIETAAYDAIFLVGLIETGHSLIAANHDIRLPHQITADAPRLWQRGKRQPDLAAGKQIATWAMFEAAWEGIWMRSVARILLWQMKKLAPARCVLAINPMLSAGALNIVHPLRPAINAGITSGDAPRFIEMAQRKLVDKLPANVTLMVQPAQTVQDGCLTKPEYMTAAKTFYDADKSFGRFDTLHANEKYGRLLLETLFDHLSQPEGLL